MCFHSDDVMWSCDPSLLVATTLIDPHLSVVMLVTMVMWWTQGHVPTGHVRSISYDIVCS